VARRLSFSAAADELHLTQPAISRQIKALERNSASPLFNRGTRKVELTSRRRAAARLAAGCGGSTPRVRQIRQASGRGPRCSVTTFASFATLWLLPRLAGFQRSTRHRPPHLRRPTACTTWTTPRAGPGAER
jgi:LysR family glycine cleavage system transcriptional activator